MIISQKIDRIYKELDRLHTDESMQRDFIRCLINGTQDFFFLNCYRMECNYLKLTPVVGLTKIWKVRNLLKDNTETLYRAGFLDEEEKACCEIMAREILYVIERHKWFMFFYALYCKIKKARG